MRRRPPALPARLLPGLALALACTGKATPTIEAPPIDGATPPVEVAELAPPEASSPTTIPLTRHHHRASMSEVTLDPRGEAAITLDTDGGVRLWTDLRGAIEAPVALPIEEPSWVTLTRAGADRFVIAALDTAGAARVAEVELTAEGPTWRPLFELPATDPHLEIHVLEGGERLLALALDHRLRLLDRRGQAVATLDVPGFVPWQLRLSHQGDAPPKIVAMIAGPVRAQPITMRDDTLEITGEARRVDLDRGPNRNDVVLSPDGSFVTSLRRPRAAGKGWTLELIDLATDGRRWIAGDVDGTVRPRLHLVDNSRALLEVGTGKGHLVDLDAARAVPDPVDRKALKRSPTATIELAGSTEDSRMLGDFAGGVRVFAVGHDLFVDPIDDGERRAIVRPAFTPDHAAIDASGERATWSMARDLYADAPGSTAEPRRLLEADASVLSVDFVDRDRLLVTTTSGQFKLLRWEDGEELAAAQGPRSRAWGDARYHPRGDGHGVLALAPILGRLRLDLVDVDVGADALAPARPILDDERGAWPEFARSRQDRAAVADRYDLADKGRDLRGGVVAGDSVYLILADPLRIELVQGGDRRSAPLADPSLRGLRAAPERRRVAYTSAPSGLSVTSTLVVLDFEADAPTRIWSRGFASLALDYAWSADGSRLAIASAEGGVVVDGATGETLHERVDFGMRTTTLPPRSPDQPPRPGSAI